MLIIEPRTGCLQLAHYSNFSLLHLLYYSSLCLVIFNYGLQIVVFHRYLSAMVLSCLFMISVYRIISYRSRCSLSVRYIGWNNSISSLLNAIYSLDLSQFDLVLNDCESVSAWAARRQGVTCIDVSHSL